MQQRYFCPRNNDLRSTRRSLLDDLRKEYESAEALGWGEQDDQTWWFDVEVGPERDVRVLSRSAVATLEMAERARALEWRKAKERFDIDSKLLSAEHQALLRDIMERTDE